MGKETNMETLAGFCGGTLVLMIIFGILMGFSQGDMSALVLAIICIIILVFILYGGNNEKKSKPRVKVKKVSSINSDYCNECHSYIERGREHCPHCLSKDITRWETRKQNSKTKNPKYEVKYKSSLKVKETSNKNKNWCNNCCTYIPKGKDYCPNCGSIDIKKN